MTEKFANIDEYISAQPEKLRGLLEKLRHAIHSAAPEAEEAISYRMPAFKLNGILVYFAGCRNHIGFYPTGSGIDAFKKDLKAYKGTKGSVHFPLDKPLPLSLIRKIVQFRVRMNTTRLSGSSRD